MGRTARPRDEQGNPIYTEEELAKMEEKKLKKEIEKVNKRKEEKKSEEDITINLLLDEQELLIKKIYKEVDSKRDKVEFENLTDVEKCIILLDMKNKNFENREKISKEVYDNFLFNAHFTTTADKKRFLKKCEEIEIDPEKALELLAEGFVSNTFSLKSRKQWYIEKI